MSKGPEKYYAVPVIPVEDDLLHTTDKPFCYDGTCGCHEDPLLISEVAHFVDHDHQNSSRGIVWLSSQRRSVSAWQPTEPAHQYDLDAFGRRSPTLGHFCR